MFFSALKMDNLIVLSSDSDEDETNVAPTKQQIEKKKKEWKARAQINNEMIALICRSQKLDDDRKLILKKEILTSESQHITEVFKSIKNEVLGDINNETSQNLENNQSDNDNNNNNNNNQNNNHDNDDNNNNNNDNHQNNG